MNMQSHTGYKLLLQHNNIEVKSKESTDSISKSLLQN